MFGGLEIKGGDAKKDAKAADPAPAPAASSSFSFLNAAAPAPSPPPAAPASSGFSFLNAGAPAPPAVAEPAAQAPASAMSGFSFLATESPAKTEEKVAVDVPPASDAGLSAFGFMATAPAPPAEAKAEEKAAEPGAATDAVSSGFSFLSSTTAPAPPSESLIPEPAAPAATTISPMKPAASTSISSAFAPAAVTSTASSFAPAGAGISFGGAAVNAARPKKKKNRAMKVGVGAASAGGMPPPLGASSLPAPSELPKPAEDPAAQQNTNTREDALDAARRAEEFMNQKLQEQSVAEMAAKKEAENAAKAATGGKPPPAPGGVYDDEMIAAAAAAAVEAQAMNHKAPAGGARGIMGGLFRRSSPPTSSSNLSAGGGGSKPGSFSSTSGSRPPKPASVETTATKPSSATSLNSDDGKATTTSYAPVVATVPAPVPAAMRVNPSPMAAAPSFAPALPPKPAPRPVPPKPKTPEEQLSALLQTFRQNVENTMGRVTQLRHQRCQLMEERNRAMTQERLATQQRELTEQQLTAAAESEDFELADQLGGVLSSYEKEQQECARMSEHIHLAIRELDSQKQSVVEGVQMCFRTIQTQLQSFESTEEAKEHKSDDNFSKKFANMTKHLAQEHERLQNDLKHLERDEELVAEERKEVETAISEQSCDFEKQRGEAKEKLSGMEEEIEELRKQLEAKQVIAAQLRSEIAGHDDSILQVRVQFSRQLQRVQKKEGTIKDHRTEWDVEKVKFQSEKDEHEAEVKSHSEALEAHEKLMASLKEEIAMAGNLEKIVQKEVGEVDTASEDVGKDEEIDSDLLGLQAEVVKCEAAVSEAREVLKVATSTLENLETEMGALIGKIPELEAIKKAAAAKRDFKTAGKASKEIKDATARVKECQEELTGEAVERKEAAESELKKLDEELKVKREVSLEKEKETGIASMKKLAERIQHLVKTKEEVCGEDCAPDRMQGVGAFVLEEQIKSLALEGSAYGEKYGGWEELIADILPTSAAAATKQTDDATEVETAAKESAEVAAKETEPAQSQVSKNEMMASFRRLTQQLKEIEVKIESAVEQEDYDFAAELDEKLQALMTELEALNLTDDEMAEALIGGNSEEGETPAEADKPAQDEPATVEAEGELVGATTKDSADTVSAEAPVADEEVEQTKSMDSAAEEEPESVTPSASAEAAAEPSAEEEQPESLTPSASAEDAATTGPAAEGEQPESLTPSASAETATEPKSKDEEVDEKKDAEASPAEDGFVEVDDGDL